MDQPSITYLTPSYTSGTLLTYYYSVSAVGAWGESLGSTEVPVVNGPLTSGSGNSNAITWSAVSNATSYRIYRGTQPGSETLAGIQDAGGQYSFTDHGNPLPNYVVPTPVMFGGAPEVSSIVESINGQDVQQALYSYYTGWDSTGFTNDPNGRLGDLKSVTTEDITLTNGTIVVTGVTGQDYYRYYKFTGEANYLSSPQDPLTSTGPTNDKDTTGGPNPIQEAYGSDGILGDANSSNPFPDVIIWSGIKTIVDGTSFDRLAAAVPSYQSASDAQIQPFVNSFFNYERWNDHVGADGFSGWGTPGYNQNTDAFVREEYRLGTQYRVTEEIAQGDGSSSGGGQGTDYFSYAEDSYVNNAPGYASIDYGAWQMKTTEYLPTDGSSGEATDNEEITYTNLLGQPILSDFAQVSNQTYMVTQMATSGGTDGANTLYNLTAAGNFFVGERVALTGVLPELFNGIFRVYAVNASQNQITLDIPSIYLGSIAPLPTAYVSGSTTPAPGSVSPQAFVTPVLNQRGTFYQYDTNGRTTSVESPANISGYDDSSPDLTAASGSSGTVTTTTYGGWTFSGSAGITANGPNSILAAGSPNAPDGTQVAYFQSGGTVSQTVISPTAASFTMTFEVAESCQAPRITWSWKSSCRGPIRFISLRRLRIRPNP